MIVSGSRTMHPQSPRLTIGGTVLKKSDDLVILGVTFDSKMTFEKHLCSVSRAASQRVGILRKVMASVYDGSLLGRCFLGFVLPVLEYCSAVWYSAAETHLKLLDRAVSGAQFLTGVCLSVTFLIVDPWQFCVCFIGSGVTRCTLLMVLYLDRMCQPRLYAVLWLHLGSLMHRFAADPCITAGFLFLSRCPSGTILLTLYSMVWDWRVSRAGPMLLYWPKRLYLYYSLLLFSPFSSFCL